LTHQKPDYSLDWGEVLIQKHLYCRPNTPFYPTSHPEGS
jgi:hypothetical protein